MTFDPSAVISRKEAAALLQLDPSRISQLVTAGHIQRDEHGRITLQAAVQGYVRYWNDRIARQAESLADTRLRDMRAQEVELRVRERAKKTVPVAEAKAAIDFIVGESRKAFAAIPAMVADDPAERARVGAVAERAQRGITKRMEEANKLLKEGGKLPDAE